MKRILTLGLVLSFLVGNAQFDPDRNDFFEISGIVGTFARDEIKLYEDENNSTSVDVSTRYFGAGLRYGKSLTPFASLVLGINYLKREEIIPPDAVLITPEEVIYNTSTNSVHQFALQLGPQVRLVNTEKVAFSVAAGGFVRDGVRSRYDLSGGYFAKAVLGLNLNERHQINLKYGYDSIRGDYTSTSLPLEIAILYKIY